MDAKRFLKEFFYKETLEDIARDYDLPYSGTKAQIIDRLVNNVPLEEILDDHFYKDELKDICFELDLPVSGTKDDLIESILDTITDSLEKTNQSKTNTQRKDVKPETSRTERTSQTEIGKLTENLIELFRLVIVGMVVIYVTYQFMIALIPDIPLWLKGIIVLIGVSFIFPEGFCLGKKAPSMTTRPRAHL